MNLTPKQDMHLANVKRADKAWRNAKSEAASRAQILAAEEIDAYASVRDREVRLALEAGVPKLRIGQYGLGTKSPSAVSESLARTERLALVQKELSEAGHLAQSMDEAA